MGAAAPSAALGDAAAAKAGGARSAADIAAAADATTDHAAGASQGSGAATPSVFSSLLAAATDVPTSHATSSPARQDHAALERDSAVQASRAVRAGVTGGCAVASAESGAGSGPTATTVQWSAIEAAPATSTSTSNRVARAATNAVAARADATDPAAQASLTEAAAGTLESALTANKGTATASKTATPASKVGAAAHKATRKTDPAVANAAHAPPDDLGALALMLAAATVPRDAGAAASDTAAVQAPMQHHTAVADPLQSNTALAPGAIGTVTAPSTPAAPASPAATAATAAPVATAAPASPGAHHSLDALLPGFVATLASHDSAGKAAGPQTDPPAASDAAGAANPSHAEFSALPDLMRSLAGAGAGAGAGAAAGAPIVERSVTVAVSDRGWPHAVAAQVHWFAMSNVQSATLRLSPEHLGPIEVRIDLRHSQVNVSFTAAHADTRNALEQAVPKLRDMFTGSGLTLGQANVQQEPRSDSQASAARSLTAAVDAESVDPVALAPPTALGLVDEYV